MFIYQDVGDKTNGRLYSSEGLLNRLSQRAVKIKLPNLFRKGFAFFPQASYKSFSTMRECEYIFVMYTDNHDKIILEKKRSGVSAEQIALEIENSEIFDREQIVLGFEQMFQIIDEMDKTCDVKISKWIKNHYRNEMIFIDPGHISKAVYAEYMKQVLKIIGLYEMEKQNIEKVICTQPSVLFMPVYGCVRDAMNLDWSDEANDSIKKGTWVLEGKNGLNILEYVKQYIYICVENRSV